jgi:hypothetical protein
VTFVSRCEKNFLLLRLSREARRRHLIRNLVWPFVSSKGQKKTWAVQPAARCQMASRRRWLESRVTRLGEFSPKRWSFTLGSLSHERSERAKRANVVSGMVENLYRKKFSPARIGVGGCRLSVRLSVRPSVYATLSNNFWTGWAFLLKFWEPS